MRLAARLVKALRGKCKDKVHALLTELLLPQNVKRIIECTKELAGITSKNKEGEAIPSFAKSSLPLKMVYALDSVLMLLKVIGLRQKK